MVHSLRAALDYLAWQLVILNGKEPDSRVYFPVRNPTKPDPTTAKAIKDRKAVSEAEIRTFGATAMALIERLQLNPARNAPADPELRLLFLLHQLDIWDKHRRLNVVGGFVQMTGLTVGGPGEDVHINRMVLGGAGPQVMHVPTADGTELLRLRLGDETPNVNVDPKFGGYVAFEKAGPGKGKAVIETLDELIGFVDQTVTLFAPLFDPAVHDRTSRAHTGPRAPMAPPFTPPVDPANPTEKELRAIGLDPDFEIRPPGAPPRFPKKGTPK